MCPGCYKENEKGYCLSCRKLLFDGAKVSPVLNFDSPKAENLLQFQEKTRRLSISGIQLKYSLALEGNELKLTERGGQYILKPIPPTTFITDPGQAPENEHLTMQIAAQLFDIPAAANALIYFKDGTPAYITRRFDVQKDGTKTLQEDMAQISGQSRHTLGENFKYMGTYEDIGKLITKHAAAFYPALEQFFRLVLFNYIFSNGDAHLKNFSLSRTSMGDYALSPAYDLMSTVLHTPNEYDTALNLYESDMETEFYTAYGYYGQAHFRELARRIKIIDTRAAGIISHLLVMRPEVQNLVEKSFLEEATKTKYLQAYRDKLKRMGLTGEILGEVVDSKRGHLYGITKPYTKLTFRDKSIKVGFFQKRPQSDQLSKDNKYTFVEANNSGSYRDNSDDKFVTIIDANELIDVEHDGFSLANS